MAQKVATRKTKVKEQSQLKELEKYMKKYPQVPREVVVKEDLLRLGFKFTKAALSYDKPYRKKSYRLFTYDKTTHDKLSQQENLLVPEDIRFWGGPFDLRPTVVRISLIEDTPYCIDYRDGQLMILANGEHLADLVYPHLPEYYGKKFEDGTLYSEVCSMVFWGVQAFATVHRVCQYWGPGQECLFCDINENVRQRQKLGKGYSISSAYKNPAQVAETMRTIFFDEKWPEGCRPLSYVVTGGTILGKLRGLEEDDFYKEYIRAIKDKVGNRWPCHLQTSAKTKEDYQSFKDAGVNCPNANIEVWEKELFEKICPGKNALVGRDEWIRRVCDSVNVFGEGNVIPNIVIGVEMSKPYGFKTVDEAVKSTSAGLDFLMSHGVTPRFNQWCIEKGSGLGDNVPPPLDYFIRMDMAWYNTWRKYNLPPINGFGQMGPGKAHNQNSAFLDMCDESGHGGA